MISVNLFSKEVYETIYYVLNTCSRGSGKLSFLKKKFVCNVEYGFKVIFAFL